MIPAALLALLVAGYLMNSAYRRDRAELLAAREADAARIAELEVDVALAREDARAQRGGNVKLARIARLNDENTLRVADDFRRHLDGHTCLPTLDGIRAGLADVIPFPAPVEESRGLPC